MRSYYFIMEDIFDLDNKFIKTEVLKEFSDLSKAEKYLKCLIEIDSRPIYWLKHILEK